MKVYKLTLQQKDLILNNQYTTGSVFNPIQDGNEPPNWVITTQEVEQCTNHEFQWVKALPIIPWVAPAPPEPIETDATD